MPICSHERIGLNAGITGIGLRSPHHTNWLEEHPAVDFCEAHAENYFGAGGAAVSTLFSLRQDYEVSVHAVGLGLGNRSLDENHLQKLQTLVERVDPFRVSAHLCWNSAEGRNFNHLLPLPFTRESLARLAAHVDQVQELLRRPILVEHIAAYLRYADAELTEAELLNELTRKTGCSLLLDLTNMYVNSLNHGEDCNEFLKRINPASVGEIHLAGCMCNTFDDATLWIDSHDREVPEPVWELYQQALEILGPRPTLIERDANLPPLADLVAEAKRARQYLADIHQLCA